MPVRRGEEWVRSVVQGLCQGRFQEASDGWFQGGGARRVPRGRMVAGRGGRFASMDNNNDDVEEMGGYGRKRDARQLEGDDVSRLSHDGDVAMEQDVQGDARALCLNGGYDDVEMWADSFGNTLFHYIAASPFTPVHLVLRLLDVESFQHMIRMKNCFGLSPLDICLQWLDVMCN